MSIALHKDIQFKITLLLKIDLMPKGNARRSVKAVVNNQLKLGLVKATSEDIIMTMKTENARSLSTEDAGETPIISRPKQSVQELATFTLTIQVGQLASSVRK